MANKNQLNSSKIVNIKKMATPPVKGIPKGDVSLDGDFCFKKKLLP